MKKTYKRWSAALLVLTMSVGLVPLVAGITQTPLRRRRETERSN